MLVIDQQAPPTPAAQNTAREATPNRSVRGFLDAIVDAIEASRAQRGD